MTNEDLFNDLKQFIAATVSQQTAGLATKEDLAGLATKADLVQTNTKLDGAIELLHGVKEVVEDMHKKQESLIEKVDEHDVRIGRLEHKLA